MQQTIVAAVGLDPTVCKQLRELGEELPLDIIEVDAPAALSDQHRPALAICAIQHFDAMRDSHPDLPQLVIASVADSAQTIAAMKGGAIECLLAPVPTTALREQIVSAIETRDDTPRAKSPRIAVSGADDGIIGQSPAMQQVYKLIGLIAPRQVNLMLTGESGTGKEVVAKAIHLHSPRRDKPFLAVNCAAIPETLLESELFGHEKGAFTGAERQNRGKFEQADGGTLLLDEVGDMPLATQVKLLRVLQDQSFYRLGGSQLVRCDVRIIAATHQPLEQLVQAKTFRQDLYYRLKVASIHLPPLREREVDAILLAHYFVDLFGEQFGGHIRSFSPEAVKTLLFYPWPGNVRELENVIKAALVVARGSVLRAEYLPDNIRQAAPLPTHATDAAPPKQSHTGDVIGQMLDDPANAGTAYRAIIDRVETELITAALNRTDGHMQQAAQLLGISRTTLRQRIRRLGITLRATAESTSVIHHGENNKT